MPVRIPLAIVQHGNQYLITNGYANREGLTEILAGFAAVCALHLKYRVPLNLHLSGTLLEAIAWHQPDFFAWVKALRAQGLLELVGSAYAQNIMPLFSAAHNLRQLNEALRLYDLHLGVKPHAVQSLWVPERVWDTAKLARWVQCHDLRNGGYRSVLLDYRLTHPLNGAYESSPRQARDVGWLGAHYQTGEYPAQSLPPNFPNGEQPVPYRIESSQGLMALPITRELRYSIPPREPWHWQLLEQMFAPDHVRAQNEVYVYADDLEKAAGVGPWGSRPWQRQHVEPYERFLAWLSANERLEPILISPWLDNHAPHATKPIECGAYYELAQTMQAGENYQGWWRSSEWRPYRAMLRAAEHELSALTPSALTELAWKQLLACSYETAWHERDEQGQYRPAAWAKALASHARAVFVMCAAARWMTQRDGQAHVDSVDIDHDGRTEVIMRNDALYAVVSPDYGGRITYLFDLTHTGALVVGNPADDWNWQEALNRFMELPRNHPGAFADVAHENDAYSVRAMDCAAETATAHLVNCAPESALRGTEKIFRLGADASAVRVSYLLPATREPLRVEFCLSPDYLSLLREGRRSVGEFATARARGWHSGDTVVYIRKPPDESVRWGQPLQPECGHGFMLCLTAYGRQFVVELGVGWPC
ncbi:MAG: hypothetical protein ABI874_03370 [Chloroflexota bacterium]